MYLCVNRCERAVPGMRGVSERCPALGCTWSTGVSELCLASRGVSERCARAVVGIERWEPAVPRTRVYLVNRCEGAVPGIKRCERAVPRTRTYLCVNRCERAVPGMRGVSERCPALGCTWSTGVSELCLASRGVSERCPAAGGRRASVKNT
ncbi:hypothetical protein NDU88_002158 [Pleurodeles waltl]|uniref:Uncharacterized protein n=1 Tax=Pleurodeles waltl TaxID=8319 RepID=A0AAV7MQL0_PLEWA|nr:hypothetical protein NDU88_002158 [Pleurodeles waltl]